MSTYSPWKYIPFKKRIRGAFIGSIAVGLFIFLHDYIADFFTKNNTEAPHNSMSQEDQTLSILFLGAMFLVLIGIIAYSQIWVLDKVIIDTKRKTIRILIRKFDTIIDKGEFDIDENLKVKVQIKRGHIKKSPITVIRIKYGKKIIFTQSNSNFMGAPNWTSASFLHIRDEVENIKQFNFSSLQYKG